MRILIADDTATDRMIMSAFLKALGHDIVAVENGQAAITAYLEHKPDLVIMDVLMPGMDGYETVQRLRRLDEEWVPVIFLSACTEPEDIARGIEAGGDDYLAKPFDRTVLKAKMVAMQRIARMRARLLKVSMELESANQALRNLADVDGLTGLANRRFLDRHLAAEVADCSERGLAISVIMIDIDHFKAFNDAYGHLAGDKCLRQAADILREQISRQSDLAARYGGEEFCLVLPNTDIVGATHLAETIRKRVEERAVPNEGGGEKGIVTFSLGVCTALPSEATPPRDLLKAADAALYEAKQRGRNRVVVHELT